MYRRWGTKYRWRHTVSSDEQQVSRQRNRSILGSMRWCARVSKNRYPYVSRCSDTHVSYEYATSAGRCRLGECTRTCWKEAQCRWRTVCYKLLSNAYEISRCPPHFISEQYLRVAIWNVCSHHLRFELLARVVAMWRQKVNAFISGGSTSWDS